MKPLDPRLLRTAPGARRPVAVLAGVGVLQGISTIALAFALTALAVAVVGSRPIGAPAAWVGGIFAVRAGLAWSAERIAARAGVAVSTAIRRLLLERWTSLPADARPAPDRAVTLAAQGCSTIEPYAARFLPALVAGVCVPVLAVAALLWVDWVSALIVVATLPLLPLFAALIGTSTQADTDRRWQALASLSGHFLDVMRGLPTLVGHGRAEHQVGTIAEVSRRHRVATMRTLRLAFLSSAALELLASISVAIVAVSVGLRLTHGTMTLAAGLLAILLSPEAYWPIRRVGAEFHAAADGAEAIAAALAELDPPSVATVPRDAASASRGCVGGRCVGGRCVGGRCVEGGCDEVGVRVDDVSYTYAGAERPVLEHVGLSAAPGLTVVTGVSGVGKSTLLELIAGLRAVDPGHGSIHAGRAHLVSQRPFLTTGTLRDALTLGNDAPDPALWDALREVGLDGFVASLPQALATPVGDDGFGLSAGQRARTAIARALLTTAPVVLLDEPTAHLDEVATVKVHDAITRLAERHTVIAVTHRPELVMLADQHVHLLRRGVEVAL